MDDNDKDNADNTNSKDEQKDNVDPRLEPENAKNQNLKPRGLGALQPGNTGAKFPEHQKDVGTQDRQHEKENSRDFSKDNNLSERVGTKLGVDEKNKGPLSQEFADAKLKESERSDWSSKGNDDDGKQR